MKSLSNNGGDESKKRQQGSSMAAARSRWWLLGRGRQIADHNTPELRHITQARCRKRLVEGRATRLGRLQHASHIALRGALPPPLIHPVSRGSMQAFRTEQSRRSAQLIPELPSSNTFSFSLDVPSSARPARPSSATPPTPPAPPLTSTHRDRNRPQPVPQSGPPTQMIPRLRRGWWGAADCGLPAIAAPHHPHRKRRH